MRKNNWVYNLFHSIKYSKERKLNCIFLEDIQFKDKYIELINSITASDIINVANKYFNDNFVTSIVKELQSESKKAQ